MRFLHLFLIGVALSWSGCEGEGPEPAAAESAAATATADTTPLSNCCTGEELGAPLPGSSVYQLESEWRDQSGATRKLASFRGRPVVLDMIFTTCEYACPRIMSDLKGIETELGDRLEAVRFVLISFDAERDLPPVLAAYATKQHLDLERWTLLHGADPDVRELAAVLGIKYKKSETVGFSHSNVLTLLDAEGGIAHRLKGLGAAPAPLLERLRQLSQ
jgi:protein SCO1/2